MASTTHPHLNRELLEAKRKIERWRRTRHRRTAMPEHLWQAAADVARVLGVNPVARAVRLDYYSLKKRVEAEGEAGNGSGSFIEVAVTGASSPANGSLVEVERPDGARMRIHLATNREVLDLAESFWR